jgi:hypothetical protein
MGPWRHPLEPHNQYKYRPRLILGIRTEMGIFRMAKVVQCKSHCSHAKNIVAVIHVTQGHYASNSFLRLTTSRSARSWMKNGLRFSMSQTWPSMWLDTMHLLQR